MSFEFIYSDLIKLLLLAGVIYLCYRLYLRGNHKWSIGIGMLSAVLFLVHPPFVREYDSFENIEKAERYEVESERTLPARVTVDSEPSFEERVKQDLEEYENNREINMEGKPNDKND